MSKINKTISKRKSNLKVNNNHVELSLQNKRESFNPAGATPFEKFSLNQSKIDHLP